MLEYGFFMRGVDTEKLEASNICDEVVNAQWLAYKMFENAAGDVRVYGKKIKEWVDYARQTRWRRFAEEKPLLGDRVLCTNGRCVFEQVLCVKNDGTYKWDRCGLPAAMQDVTHWMPLPEPPKEE